MVDQDSRVNMPWRLGLTSGAPTRSRGTGPPPEPDEANDGGAMVVDPGALARGVRHTIACRRL